MSERARARERESERVRERERVRENQRRRERPSMSTPRPSQVVGYLLRTALPDKSEVRIIRNFNTNLRNLRNLHYYSMREVRTIGKSNRILRSLVQS